MLARLRKTTEENDEGFTLIELLVVVIIIGILAAIAIPTFLNQRQNGYRAQVISDLRNAATAAESFAVDRNGLYTGLAATNIEGEKSTDVTFGAPTVSADGTTFCIPATHARLGTAQTFAFAKAQRQPLPGTCGANAAFTPRTVT